MNLNFRPKINKTLLYLDFSTNYNFNKPFFIQFISNLFVYKCKSFKLWAQINMANEAFYDELISEYRYSIFDT